MYYEHVRKHLGQRPYLCRPCNKSYAQVSVVKLKGMSESLFKSKLEDPGKQSLDFKYERELSYKLNGFLLLCWMGQSAEQSTEMITRMYDEDRMTYAVKNSRRISSSKYF